jgi:hypothetical protein
VTLGFSFMNVVKHLYNNVRCDSFSNKKYDLIRRGEVSYFLRINCYPVPYGQVHKFPIKVRRRFSFSLVRFMLTPALVPIQPPIQWISRVLSSGVKLTTHLH